jgi:hypothetical protein
VEKQVKGDYRMISDVQLLNKVTIWDSGLPPAVDEFSEDFAGYPITSALDYYSRYFQIPLDMESMDMTAFMTELGLLWITRLPQGWTNSVAVFQRIMGKVHWRLIPKNLRPFIDDMGMKGLRDSYSDVEITPGVRKFVWEHAQIFQQFMHDSWMAGLTISGAKSAIGMSGIAIVGFLCDVQGRRPHPKKVAKILSWPTPRSITWARAFIGIVIRDAQPRFGLGLGPVQCVGPTFYEMESDRTDRRLNLDRSLTYPSSEL